MFSRFSLALLLYTSFLVNNTALGLVYHGAGEGKNGERSIIFGQVPGNVEQQVILTICADSESEEINIPDLQGGPFRIVTNLSGSPSAESCASVVIAYQGTENTDSCGYTYHESKMTVNNDVIRLSGITVSPEYWETLQDYSGWRYAGSLEQPQGPYMISASNDKLLWLNRKVPSKTYGFTDYRLNQTTGDFYYRFNRLNADHLEPYADVLSSFGLSDLNDGISLINAGDEQDDFFAGVQSNGFVLTYNMSINSPPSSVADPLAPLSADYWVQQGFGGSPRPGELGGLCLINGTCIGLSPESNAVATDRCPCEFNYPSKGESIAVSPTGNCLVVANPLYDEINTLLRSKENPAIFDRSFFNEVGGMSLIGKRPEIVAIDNTGRVLIVNKNSNTAILCSLQEDQGECELTDCREQCQPEYASVTSAGFLEDSNGSFFVTNAMDHRIHVFDAGGSELYRWPESQEQCGIIKAVAHPTKPIVALLYRNPGRMYLLRWNGSEFEEIVRFDEQKLASFKQPSDAVFLSSGEHDNLFVALEGSQQIARFQAFPDNHELPKGLFEISMSMNQSSYSNSSCLSLNHTLTQLCTYGNSSGECSDNTADKIGIIGGVLGGVTTVAILVGAGLFIAKMIYRTKVERR